MKNDKGHKMSDLEKIQLISKPNEEKNHFNSFLREFSDFQKDLVASMSFSLRKYHKDFNENVDKVISILETLKNSNANKSAEQFEYFNLQLDLIKTSFERISEMLNEDLDLHPNKQYQLQRFLNNLQNKKMELIKCLKPKLDNELNIIKLLRYQILEIETKLLEENDNTFGKNFWNIGDIRISNPEKNADSYNKSMVIFSNKKTTDFSNKSIGILKNHKRQDFSNNSIGSFKSEPSELILSEGFNNLVKIPDYLYKSIGILTNNKIEDFPNNSIGSFKSNPSELIHKEGILLEEKSFDFYEIKSNLACSFLINDESFLVWAGYKEYHGIPTYPLIVYNLSKKKREIILQKDNKNEISTVATYPKDEISYFSKQFLYCADKSAIVRIYRIDPEKAFELESIIETNVKIPIITLMLFEDKFEEIKKDGKTLYLLISFDSNLPVILYKKIKQENDIKDKWQILKIIDNPEQKPCRSINFYYDEILYKTVFFFAFSCSFVKNYDLKVQEWGKIHFETKSHVSSMNFLSKKHPSTSNLSKNIIDIFLIYTQTNETIIFGDVYSGNIVRKINLKNTSGIYDCCVWMDFLSEKTYLIIAKCNINATVILNFEDLEILDEKIHEKIPRTYIKALVKVMDNLKTARYHEYLISFLNHGKTSEIILHC